MLNNPESVGLVAESDPLFPLHSKDKPLLKFLNPFYELWYETMPPVLKQLRLMNADQYPTESIVEKDDVRGHRIVRKWDPERKEWRYFAGPKDVDQAKIDEEVLYNQNMQTSVDGQEENQEANEEMNAVADTEDVDGGDDMVESADSVDADDAAESMDSSDSVDSENSEEAQSEEIQSENTESSESSESSESVESMNLESDDVKQRSIDPDDPLRGSMPKLRSSYLSNDIYDKNSYSAAELEQFLKEAPSKPADEVPIAAMNYTQEMDNWKEIKESVHSSRPRPKQSKARRAEYFVEALKRELIQPQHLEMKELHLVIKHLGLELHSKKNPNTKKMTQWVPFSAVVPRRPQRTKWKDWTGYDSSIDLTHHPSFITRYNDPGGIFGELDVYHKTRHPGQPAWGVWDIPEPNFDTEYLEMKVTAYLEGWRESKEGREYIEKEMKRTFDENKVKEKKLYGRLSKGVEMLMMERAGKEERIEENKQFRYKFGNDPSWETQCKEKTLEILKLQADCDRIDEIVGRVCLYNRL